MRPITRTRAPKRDLALTGGEWVQVGHVSHWRPAEPGRPLCGTDSGYYHHRRAHGEPTCDDCRLAHSQATAKRAAKKALFRMHPPMFEQRRQEAS